MTQNIQQEPGVFGARCHGQSRSEGRTRAIEGRERRTEATLGQRPSRSVRKGAVSVYGLGRFPVTLYKEQWEKLLSMAGEIKAFMAEHDSQLKKKE